MGSLATKTTRELQALKLHRNREMQLHERLELLIAEQRLAMVDRPLKIRDLARICGVSDTYVHQWRKDNPNIKSGVRLSLVYKFVKEYKPKYRKKLEAFIEREYNKRMNALYT